LIIISIISIADIHTMETKMKRKLKQRPLKKKASDNELLDVRRISSKNAISLDLSTDFQNDLCLGSATSSSTSDNEQLAESQCQAIPPNENLDMENLHPGLISTSEISSHETSSIKSSFGKTVQFSFVQIREFPLCIGDNPSPNRGVPISISWNHIAERVLTIDENEAKPKRQGDDLKISSLDRVRLLKEAGFSGRAIQVASKEIDVHRQHRQQTNKNLKWAELHESFDRGKNAILNATTKRAAKKRERKMLQPWKK
jgi:hypothetical protein